MFAGLGSFAYELEKQNMNYNGHMYSVSPIMFEIDLALKNFWEVTSIHYMSDGRPFVVTGTKTIAKNNFITTKQSE